MARFDLLQEYSCVVTPARSARRPAARPEAEDGRPGRGESRPAANPRAWRQGATAIVGLALVVTAIALL